MTTMNGKAATNGATRSTAEDYDEMPYPSLPVAYTQPSHLAAMATMFGLKPPNVVNARVLELGCASGGNIIPLAARFPKAAFVGIDLSQRHVEEAQKRIKLLGLKNVLVSQADITKTAFDREAFDVIICHGVFSWVPKAAQDAVFRICGESLNPNGVAAVSYNVFPGWHMRRIVRDICLLHAGKTGSPKERVEKARKALSDIAAALGGNSPYATLLRGEAERLAKMPSGYVLGEFLADNNAPSYFGEFAARAAKSGLAVFADGEVSTSLPEFFFPAAAAKIREMSQGDTRALQQYTDFFTGRPFRRSLLVREQRAAQATQQINPLTLRGLHFAANIRKDTAHSTEEKAVFIDMKGRVMTPKEASARVLLERLAQAYPSTLTFDELMGPSANDAKLGPMALSALLGMIGREQATASALPLRVGSGDGEKPCAWPIARLDAMSRQPWATGQNHLAVKIPPQLGFLLPVLDGKRDRNALVIHIQELIARTKAPATSARSVLDSTLLYAARNALLV